MTVPTWYAVPRGLLEVKKYSNLVLVRPVRILLDPQVLDKKFIGVPTGFH